MHFLKYGKQQDGKASVNGERKCGPWSSTGLLCRAWISAARKFCAGFHEPSITANSIRGFTHKAAQGCYSASLAE